MRQAYLLCGPEQGGKSDFIREISAAGTKAWGANKEEYTFYADQTDPEQVIDILRNGALFSDWKLLRYLNADSITQKQGVQVMKKYLERPSTSCILILETEAYGIDKSLEEALGKEAKKTFWELSIDQAEQWVQRYFRQQKLEIEEDAQNTLIELVGNDTQALKTECARLALFYPEGSCITGEVIEQYIAHSRQEDVFTLFASLVENPFEQSLVILQTILSSKEGNGISIISGLRWSLQRLLALHELINNGTPFEQAARTLRISSRKLLSLYHKALREWPYAKLKDLIAYSTEIDYQLRLMGSALEQGLLEVFLYSCKVLREPLPLASIDINGLI